MIQPPARLKRVKAAFTLTCLAWDAVTDTKPEFPLNSPSLLLTAGSSKSRPTQQRFSVLLLPLHSQLALSQPSRLPHPHRSLTPRQTLFLGARLLRPENSPYICPSTHPQAAPLPSLAPRAHSRAVASVVRRLTHGPRRHRPPFTGRRIQTHARGAPRPFIGCAP